MNPRREERSGFTLQCCSHVRCRVLREEGGRAHLLHTEQCFDLAGLRHWQVQQCSACCGVPGSWGYMRVCTSKFLAVIFPGSLQQAMQNIARHAPKANAPVNLHGEQPSPFNIDLLAMAGTNSRPGELLEMCWQRWRTGARGAHRAEARSRRGLGSRTDIPLPGCPNKRTAAPDWSCCSKHPLLCSGLGCLCRRRGVRSGAYITTALFSLGRPDRQGALFNH